MPESVRRLQARWSSRAQRSEVIFIVNTSHLW
jgi:hypothetical protein